VDWILGIPLVLLAGIVPMLVYAVVLWWFDRYEKEPLGLLIAAFLWGAIPAIIFSLFVEVILDVPISYFVDASTASLVGATVVAPVVEELFKGLALVLLFVFFHHEIDSPLDGIIYGGLVGFGFAAVENIFYFGSALAAGGLGSVLSLALLRAFVFGLNHALFTSFTGLGIAIARTAHHWPLKVTAPLLGLSLGIASHAVHNGSVSLAGEVGWPCLVALLSDWGGVVMLLAVIVGATVQERRWIVTYLADEVGRGTLSQEEYEIIASYWRRIVHRLSVLFSGDLKRWWRLERYYRLATELAFNKRRLAHFPSEQRTEVRVILLRQQIQDGV